MAASNLVVKLLLESGAFDKNIKTAKASIEGFEKVGKNIVGTFGKVAGVLGIATTAYEVLQTAINSSVNGTAAFETAVDAAKTSVNQFFYSLTSGNFDTFLTGLDDTIKKAKATKDALLELSFSQLGYNYVKSENKALSDTYKQQAQDPRLSKAQRMDAIQKYNEVVEKHASDLQTHTEKALNWIRQAASKNTPFSAEDVNEDMLYTFLEKLLYEGREYMLATAKTANQQYRNSVEQLLPSDVSRQDWNDFWYGINMFFRGSTGLAGSWFNYDQTKVGQTDAELTSNITNWFYDVFRKAPSDEIVKEINKILAEYAESYMTESLLNFDQETLKEIVSTLTQIRGERSELASMKQGSTELANMRFDQPTSSQTPTSSSTSKVKEQPLYGSIEWYKAEIAKLTKEANRIDLSVDKAKYDDTMAKIEKLQLEMDALLKVGTVEMPDFSDTSWMEDMEFEIIPVDEQTTENLFSYSEALNSVASAMASISNVTSEGASAWLTWMANVITACAAASDAIKQVVAAKAAEAAANAGAEATKTGPWGFLLAAGAIATVLAAFASIPKFADGGIVNSPFTSGDKVLARVNGGEMILNKHQQSNLFNLLDGGTTTSGTKQVEFKISGKELVGVLNNYNNKMSKLR